MFVMQAQGLEGIEFSDGIRNMKLPSDNQVFFTKRSIYKEIIIIDSCQFLLKLH